MTNDYSQSIFKIGQNIGLRNNEKFLNIYQNILTVRIGKHQTDFQLYSTIGQRDSNIAVIF